MIHNLSSVCLQSSILLNTKGIELQLTRWMASCTSHIEGWIHPYWKQQNRKKKRSWTAVLQLLNLTEERFFLLLCC